MIIDAHAHAFPFVGNKGIFSTEAEHIRFLQRHMTTHPQGGRRFRDNSLSDRPTLWDGRTPGVAGLLDVNFRVGPYGRFEWEKDGDGYYMQFFPVSLEVMEAKPERMLAQMQYVGVDKAMLQFAKMYAITNEYHSDCVQRWPHKFRACTAVDEDRADDKSQIDVLRHAVKNLGLTALYFECNGYGKSDYRNHHDDGKYNRFWEEVQTLGIPVLWDIRIAIRRTSHASYMEEAMRLLNLIGRFPRIRHVITHGFPSSAFSSPGVIPEELWSLMRHPMVTTELLFPILYGSTWDYPFTEAQPIIREALKRCGPTKFIWGADMPNVERSCTYAQSLNYLRKHCDFIPAGDMDLILGGNAEELYFSVQPEGVAKQPHQA
jgi:predicted TIM-barrel fold metal-dependent hydrolase